jgi:ribose transport system substrate-binding protein
MHRVLKARSIPIRVVLALLVVSSMAISVPLVASARTAPAAKHYTFVVSNNFLGNNWRPQVELLAKLTAKYKPFKGHVTVKVVNSGPTVADQNADLSNIIATKPAVILLIASDTNAQDGVVQQACQAGILVITVSGPVNAPCAYNVNQNFNLGMVQVGRWMGQILKGKGSVFADNGLGGNPESNTILQGFLTGLKKTGPKIKDVGNFNGMFAQGPEQSGISALIPAHPNVKGVMTEGYCIPVFNAFKDAGKKAVPATCFGYNGELVACAKGTGHKCAILSGSPEVIQTCMQIAWKILNGTGSKYKPGPSHVYPIPLYLFVTDLSKVNLGHPKGITIEQITLHKNAFPKLPPGLALPYSYPQYPITAKQASGK